MNKAAIVVFGDSSQQAIMELLKDNMVSVIAVVQTNPERTKVRGIYRFYYLNSFPCYSPFIS